MSTKYAIIDIETTGGKANRDKITEIGIVIHDGKQIINTFESLVNPEQSIPFMITRLTGITNEMVSEAPKFFELAKTIVEMTENTVFVAHNVRFDYSFIQEEFKRLGFSFSKKQLCTVKLSRKAFPGLKSYSLGNLIKHFEIKVQDRHRALADAVATADIFERIMNSKYLPGGIDDFIKRGIKTTKLPDHIPLENLNELPATTGVYYFLDDQQNVIYIGKAKDIKARVFQHFQKITSKSDKLKSLAHSITYQETGSELIALLLESKEIKEIQPSINRAQKNKEYPYFSHIVTDYSGSKQVAIIRRKAQNHLGKEVISNYKTLVNARAHLQSLCTEYGICLNRIDVKNKHFIFCKCMGTCTQQSSETQNILISNLRSKEQKIFDKNILFIDQGRHPNEKVAIQIMDGNYHGYAYLDMTEGYTTEDILESINPQDNYSDMNRIISTFLKNNPLKSIEY